MPVFSSKKDLVPFFASLEVVVSVTSSTPYEERGHTSPIDSKSASSSLISKSSMLEYTVTKKPGKSKRFNPGLTHKHTIGTPGQIRTDTV